MPAAPPPLFTRRWIESLAPAGPRQLTLTADRVVTSGGDAPIEARTFVDGRVAWTADLHTRVSPVALAELLVVATPDAIVGLDAAAGQTRWTARFAGTTALTAGENTIVAAGRDGLRAIRAADGLMLWEVGPAGEAPLVLAAGASVAVASADRTLSGFDLSSGAQLWRTSLDITPLALAITPRRIFLTASEGYVCAYRTQDGGLEWCFPVRVRPVGAPLPDGPHLYVAFLDAMIRVFDADNGARRRALTAAARPIDGPRIAGSRLAVPLVTSEFVVFSSSEDFKPTRVPGFDSAETPPTLQAGAVAADGTLLAMIMTSPARTSVVLLQKAPPAAGPSADSPPDAVRPPAP